MIMEILATNTVPTRDIAQQLIDSVFKDSNKESNDIPSDNSGNGGNDRIIHTSFGDEWSKRKAAAAQVALLWQTETPESIRIMNFGVSGSNRLTPLETYNLLRNELTTLWHRDQIRTLSEALSLSLLTAEGKQFLSNAQRYAMASGIKPDAVLALRDLGIDLSRDWLGVLEGDLATIKVGEARLQKIHRGWIQGFLKPPVGFNFEDSIHLHSRWLNSLR